jgi:hypothetical protein
MGEGPAVVVLALAVAACGGRKAQKMVLRYHPPAGAVYRQTIEQHTRVTAPPGLFAGLREELNVRVYSTQTVKGPTPGGGIEVDFVADSASMTMPRMSPDTIARHLAEVRGMRNTVVYDDRAQLVQSVLAHRPSPGPATQMAYMLQGPAYAFPEQPVGPGDSWTIRAELPLKEFLGSAASSTDPAQTTITVREIQVHGADTSVVLDVTTAYPARPIHLEIAGLRASMKLSGELGGYQEFSITRGSVVAADIKGSITMALSIPTISMRDARVKSETRSTIRLSDAP